MSSSRSGRYDGDDGDYGLIMVVEMRSMGVLTPPPPITMSGTTGKRRTIR
jgi:hypothetical protein